MHACAQTRRAYAENTRAGSTPWHAACSMSTNAEHRYRRDHNPQPQSPPQPQRQTQKNSGNADGDGSAGGRSSDGEGGSEVAPRAFLSSRPPALLPGSACLPTSLTPHPPTFLPSYLPTFLPSYLPTSLPSHLPTLLPYYHPAPIHTTTDRSHLLPCTLLPPFLPTHRAARTIKKA